MNKLLASIVFGTGLLLSACTVHHYHHTVKDSGDSAGKSCEHGQKGYHSLPEGHPPVEGHGMKGHGMKGHGMKGHGTLPKGHPKVEDHGGMKGHDGAMKGHHGEGHGGDEAHKSMHAILPVQVTAFHDSFAKVWHEENDSLRSTTGCAKVGKWTTLAKGVGEHKAQRDQAIAYAAAAKTLSEKVEGVSAACRQKKASIQTELAATHDALHGVMKALAK